MNLILGSLFWTQKSHEIEAKKLCEAWFDGVGKARWEGRRLFWVSGMAEGRFKSLAGSGQIPSALHFVR